jgi:hypothetical protein
VGNRSKRTTLSRRRHINRSYLLAIVLTACAGSEMLGGVESTSDATAGGGGLATGTGNGGDAGSGGFGGSGAAGRGVTGGASGGGLGGNGAGGGGVTGGASGSGAGGAVIDASAGPDAGHRDASMDEASTTDVREADRITETRDAGRGEPEAGDGDAEGGTCGPAICFDVFDCWIFSPQCNYTACELFACKK